MEKELEVLLEDAILVTPTLPDVAPFHGLTVLRPGILGTTGKLQMSLVNKVGWMKFA